MNITLLNTKCMTCTRE